MALTWKSEYWTKPTKKKKEVITCYDYGEPIKKPKYFVATGFGDVDIWKPICAQCHKEEYGE